MIRLILGFLIVYGSAGALEVDPYAPILPSLMWAIFGLMLFVAVLDGTLDENFSGE